MTFNTNQSLAASPTETLGLGSNKEVARHIGLESRAFTRKSVGVPSLIISLASLIVFVASPSCHGLTYGLGQTVSQSLPGSATRLDSASLVAELNQAILVLKRGLREKWGTRDQYLSAVEKTLDVNSTSRPMTDAKKYVDCAIGGHLRTHQAWDEGTPIEFEVRGTIAEFIRLRDDAEQAREAYSRSSDAGGRAAEFHLPPCIAPAYRPTVISAGVAATMLKTKIDPTYPAELDKHHISGTVVLHATIGSDGHVSALRVISGPAQLHQAALDAVRHWVYRPYLLNGGPIEVETTIDVAFVLNK